MKTEVINRLNALNREFYQCFAQSFASSRTPNEPGLERIMAHMTSGQRVLDLGCGQGRIARLIPEGSTYTGIDYSDALLDIARQQTVDAQLDAVFYQADLLGGKWMDLANGKFDWIFIRAVLHHIPAFDMRTAILKNAASKLSKDGRLVIANWQFLDIPRLAKRILPWSCIGLSDTDVEPGDYLLDWQRDGTGMRYVHLVDEKETREAADQSRLLIEEMFYADGHTNRLTLYAVFIKGPTISP